MADLLMPILLVCIGCVLLAVILLYAVYSTACKRMGISFVDFLLFRANRKHNLTDQEYRQSNKILVAVLSIALALILTMVFDP